MTAKAESRWWDALDNVAPDSALVQGAIRFIGEEVHVPSNRFEVAPLSESSAVQFLRALDESQKADGS